MSEKDQKTAHSTRQKMERRYGEAGVHKHDKDHMAIPEPEKHHPHEAHGGDPGGHKHPVKQHEGRHEASTGRHEHTKERDHKEHTREHHKKARR
jgi:hypothetical protein